MNQVSFQGIGDIAVSSQSEGSAAKPSVWDQINNAVKTAGNVAQVANQVKTVISKPSSNSTSTANNPFITDASGNASVTPAPAATPDNTKKYVMLGGGVLVLGTVIFFATRKKGKK